MTCQEERESQENKEDQAFFFSKLGLYKQVYVKFTVFENCKIYAYNYFPNTRFNLEK